MFHLNIHFHANQTHFHMKGSRADTGEGGSRYGPPTALPYRGSGACYPGTFLKFRTPEMGFAPRLVLKQRHNVTRK